MNLSLDWINDELNTSFTVPAEEQSMAAWRERILNSEQVIVFGASGAGTRAFKVLQKMGVKVAFFLDNNPEVTQQAVPIYLPKAAPSSTLPLIITSAWYAEIVHSLELLATKFDLNQVFPMPDVLQLESTIYDDAVGFPFYEVLENRLYDFQNVWELYENQESKDRFLKLVAYRLNFFQMLNMSLDLLPCEVDDYHKGNKAVQHMVFDENLTEEVKNLIRYQYAHPSYWEEGFLQPQLGDYVIDGGAWYGDTAYWYVSKIGEEGKVFAFEPGHLAVNELINTIEKSGLNDCVRIENKALSIKPGYSAWSELPDASPCSHLVASGSEHDNNVELTSIDLFVNENEIQKIEVIKLDVEGADFDALKGAINVIDRFTPDLAISIYHSAHHLVDIPLWIAAQDLGYRLRLSHNQLSFTETVCLATCRDVQKNSVGTI